MGGDPGGGGEVGGSYRSKRRRWKDGGRVYLGGGSEVYTYSI